jgi:hypothetical protein
MNATQKSIENIEQFTPSVTIDLNDATFLAIVLNQWIEKSQITPTTHMLNLVANLQGKAGC